MKIAEVIVKILEDEGIRAAFGIPGAGINPVYEFLKDSSIEHYLARHEEGALHAAGGYYRAKKELAVAICTSGPGATNFITGLYTAYIDSIPLIALTGQGNRDQFGKDAFQCVNISKIAEEVCKETFCAMDPEEIPTLFRKAFQIAREGRPGPVLIDLPLDVQNCEIDYNEEDDSSLPIIRREPKREEIKKALEMIREGENPVLLIGGGVLLSGAEKESIQFAERLSLPVITTYMAKGAIPHDHPLFVGQIGQQVGTPYGNKFFLESCLVIGIGCRFNDRHTGDIEVYTEGKTFIHIDVDKEEIGKNVPVELGIVADAKQALLALLEEAQKMEIEGVKSERIEGIPREREEMERETYFDTLPIKPQRVFYAMNQIFDEDTIFFTGCGLNQIWSGQFQKIKRPRHYLPSGGAGTLGYDIPAAIGAKVALPHKTVVAVMGDGGFMFLVEELAMAVQHHIPIIVIILNNGYLSLIRQNQKYAYKYEYGVDLWERDYKTDFPLIAKGCGAEAERVEVPEEIEEALERAKTAHKPYVIDILVDRHTDASMGPNLKAIKEF